MAGSLSTYAVNKWVDHVLGTTAWGTPPANVYLALSTANPGADGSGIAEPSGNGYIRKAISFGAAASRQVAQDAVCTFDTATGAWGNIGYWAVFDAESSGNMLAYGSLSTARDVVAGNKPSIASGQTTITINTGGVSNYLANACLDHIFNNSAFTQPTIYVALCEAELTDASTGATIDEMDMTGYAREACSGWGAASGGASDNDALINFGALTSTGETVTATCLTDNASTGAGNVLFYDNGTNQPVADGDTVQFPAGDFDVSQT